ncbi:MAG: tetratricopeptide repeat protein [Bacteroidia bacterium]
MIVFIRKKPLLSVLFIFLYLSVFAQSQGKDSLLYKNFKAHIDSAQNILFNNPKNAARIATKARDLAVKGNFQLDIGDAYNTIGNAFHLLGDYKEAAYNYGQALKVFEKNKSTRGKVATFINLGVLHIDQNDLDGAKKYYNQAVENALIIKDSANLASCYNNLGIVYQQQEKLDSALLLYNKGLEIRKVLNRTGAVCNSYINIATVYYDKKEYEKSIEHLLNAYTLDSTYSSDLLFKNLSDVYLQLGKFTEAEQFGLKALQITQKTENKKLLAYVYQNLYVVYQKLNQPQKAYDFADMAFKIKEELSSEENKRIISEMDAKYESEKKEQQIALQESQLEREKTLRYSMVVIIFLFIAFVIFLYLAYRNKKKTSLLLAQQKAMIEEQKMIVEEKQKALLDSIHYAKRIQQALLPTESYIERIFYKIKNDK